MATDRVVSLSGGERATRRAGGVRAAAPAGPTEDLSAAQLLRAARRGDPSAFMSLMDPLLPAIKSLAYRLLDNAVDLPDVLQEVYLSAYRALPKFRGDASLATWMYRITYNACLAQRRRDERNRGSEPAEEAPSGDHADAVAKRLDLAAALAALPIEQRALVLMVDRDGFDYRSAAEALDLPIGTVSSRLASARARLRKALSPNLARGDA
jgi:RNA polymerase sigma-70 factor (ECF subfamily)